MKIKGMEKESRIGAETEYFWFQAERGTLLWQPNGYQGNLGRLDL